MNWQKYRKLGAAAVGLMLLFIMKRMDIYIPGIPEMVAEVVVSALTAWGVFQMKNETAKKDDSDNFTGV